MKLKDDSQIRNANRKRRKNQLNCSDTIGAPKILLNTNEKANQL